MPGSERESRLTEAQVTSLLQTQLHLMQLTKELSVFAIKTITTLNAGAILAVLAFIGHVVGSSKKVDITQFGLVITCFTFGMIAAFLAILFSYLNSIAGWTSFDVNAIGAYQGSREDAVTRYETEGKRTAKMVNRWQMLAIFSLVLSAIFFVIGLGFGILALGSLDVT